MISSDPVEISYKAYLKNKRPVLVRTARLGKPEYTPLSTKPEGDGGSWERAEESGDTGGPEAKEWKGPTLEGFYSLWEEPAKWASAGSLKRGGRSGGLWQGAMKKEWV